MSKEKEVAKQVIEAAEDLKGSVEAVKNSVNDLLGGYMKKMKDVMGDIPDEATFIKIVAAILDELIVLPQPAEMIDGYILNFLLKLLDKHVLDKFLGADWFDKLKAQVA